MIHEDLHGKAQYKEKFYFLAKKSLDIFRQPFCKQEMTSFLAKEDKNICRYVRQQLYYQQPKWMKWQAKLYQAGDNLLTKQLMTFIRRFNLFVPALSARFFKISHLITSNFQLIIEKKNKISKFSILQLFMQRFLAIFMIE